MEDLRLHQLVMAAMTMKFHRSGDTGANVDAETIAQMRAGGFTEEEIFAWIKVAEAATACLALPTLHTMEREEVCHDFHHIQNFILGRVGMRVLGRKPIDESAKFPKRQIREGFPMRGDAGKRTSEGKGLTDTGHEEPTEAKE